MRGLFVKNDVDQICFINIDSSEQNISQIRYKTKQHIAVFYDDAGGEEMFAMEIEPVIEAALVQLEKIMVVNMNVEEGHQAYVVPLFMDLLLLLCWDFFLNPPPAGALRLYALTARGRGSNPPSGSRG